MNRGDHAATGEESPEDTQEEGGKNQDHIPHLHHAALFLHHHRVQKSGPGKPGHQGGVFHRVPAPVAAPSEYGIGPARSQEDPHGEEQPRQHGPMPGGLDPLLPRLLRNERGQCKGKGDRESHIPQVQHGRMDCHGGILQQRIQSVAVQRALDDHLPALAHREQLERRGDKNIQRQEKALDRH